MNPSREVKKIRAEIGGGEASAPVHSSAQPFDGAETPAALAHSASYGKFTRTALWRLFDALAFALVTGLVENLLINCPPQVGKSRYWSHAFPAWWLLRHPAHRIVLGSYSHANAGSWGRKTRDLIKRNPKIFGGLKVREDVQSRSEFELAGHEGGMVTVGVEGGIAGRAAEVVILDDPIADANAAASVVEREKLWTWIEEEAFSRLQKNGKKIVVMTRRATDDPPGRIIELDQAGKEPWTIVRLPALAEEDEYWPTWGWRRKAGEALVPELHDAAELLRTQMARGPHTWAGLYQQAPYPRGGGDLKGEWFKIVDASPVFTSCVRAWDLAGSESKTAARTAGVYMTRRFDQGANRYHLADVKVGRWNPGRRDEIILQTAKLDGKGVPIVIEQEPGSGGLAQVQALISKLSGWSVKAVPASGSKELRADPLAAQASVGNVTIRSGTWNAEFLAEADAFPDGPTIDMVDAAAHAFNYLAAQEEPEVLDLEKMLGPTADRVFGPRPHEGSIFYGDDGGNFEPGNFEPWLYE